MSLDFVRPWAPVVLSLLRMLAAASFATHGAMKLFGWPAPFPQPVSGMLFAAGVIEVVGGALLVLGLFSGLAALVLSGEMAIAYFLAHAGKSFFPVLNGGEPAMLYCWIFLLVAAYGPGPISLDQRFGRNERSGRTQKQNAPYTE
ncbi:DoxX family protein [Salmonella enterica subsp. enterica serovar Kottbus]|nr:DoxX family protein [Salmonella enterica subsp. enterica serovar Kottbus]